jgi:hypothetical protein
MKAAWYNNFGKADEVLEIGDLEKPEPGRGEVLVRLHASSVNPSDVKKRAGLLPSLLDDGYVIPHSDGAGVIEAVGTGVSAAHIGERVWIYQAQHGRRFGTAAEYVCLAAIVSVNNAPELGQMKRLGHSQQRRVSNDGKKPGGYKAWNRSLYRAEKRPAQREADPWSCQGYPHQIGFSPSRHQGSLGRWTGGPG